MRPSKKKRKTVEKSSIGRGIEKKSEKARVRKARTRGREIELYRKDNDLMWALFDGKERDKLIRYLEGVIANVKLHYGDRLERLSARVAYSKTEETDLGQLPVPPQEILDIMDWMCYNPDINVQHLFLFFSISLRPGVLQYFMSDEVKLTNKPRFELWVQKMLVPECENVSSGWVSTTKITPANFVRSLRTSYVNWCGLPIPPQEYLSDV